MKRYSESFKGRTALVTGGARRIGRAIALELSQLGVDVVIHYSKSKDDAEDTVQKIRANGVKGYALQSDMNNFEESEGLLYRSVKLIGPIDFLINNASNYFESTLETITPKNLQDSMSVNTFSPLLISRAFARQGIKSVIVNLLDTRIYSYDREHVAYSLSKKSLFALTKMLAYEYSPHLRVNAVAPGIILPPEGQGVEWLERFKHTNPLGSYGSVEDVTDAVLFLLASEFITGEVLRVDGGRHLKNNFYG